MFLLFLVICAISAWLVSKLFNTKSKTVIAKNIGYEKYNKFGHSYISPILNYEVNGVKYRCVYMLLYCEDTPANRQLYMNEEYKLYYDEKHPNIVSRLEKGKIEQLGIFLLIFTVLSAILLPFYISVVGG